MPENILQSGWNEISRGEKVGSVALSSLGALVTIGSITLTAVLSDESMPVHLKIFAGTAISVGMLMTVAPAMGIAAKGFFSDRGEQEPLMDGETPTPGYNAQGS